MLAVPVMRRKRQVNLTLRLGSFTSLARSRPERDT